LKSCFLWIFWLNPIRWQKMIRDEKRWDRFIIKYMINNWLFIIWIELIWLVFWLRVVHARKCLLNGIYSPHQNRTIPPLKYHVFSRERWCCLVDDIFEILVCVWNLFIFLIIFDDIWLIGVDHLFHRLCVSLIEFDHHIFFILLFNKKRWFINWWEISHN